MALEAVRGAIEGFGRCDYGYYLLLCLDLLSGRFPVQARDVR